MEQNPIRNDTRKVRRVRRLGDGTVCSQCGERDPRALVPGADPVLCYECLAAAEGRPTKEEHHPAGRHNLTFTAMVPGNDHRVLSENQQSWPEKTFHNPHGSPLLKAAGALRGWLNVLQIIIERGVGWIPAFLEALDAWLEERLGAEWWRQMPRR